ncbi:LacI family DNA-binding transcriptional regulator [Eleftheria terrae]|uniref:LacI family DNA-binding transcriptional regulator n=1 Tax=Eleftheria terrae TaxID=1597781 RepID=UPI00263BC878|nr:LacI family DNA-binding transcriptional regulator [Eleftheria terrae]WKB55837.1 LacI family transcriptional regulator [Eleftheria terrae]
MTTRSVTLRDIAAAAGVSVGTVSRALKNQPGLSEQTRAEVLKVAEREGYDLAKLRPSRRRLLFLINRSHAKLSDNPFYSRVLQGAEDACREEAVSLSLLSLGPDDPIAELVRRHEPDALLSAGFFETAMLEQIRATDLPLVLVDHHAAGAFCVNDDNLLGAWLAARHLIEQGCQRIAMISGPLAHHSIALRYKGYRKALFDAGRLADPELEVSLDPSLPYEDAAVNAMQQLLALPQRPDGVLAYNDATALTAMQHCLAEGVRIPQDIAFAGYDDIAAAARFRPSLTTVRVDKEELGRLAALHLIRGHLAPGEDLRPVELLVRDSSRRRR